MRETLVLLVAFVAQSVWSAPTTNRANMLEKRKPQSSGLVAVLGGLNNMVSSFGKSRPVSNVERLQSKPSTQFEGAHSRKVRYGPYRIPPISERNVEFDLLGVSGMTNTFELNAMKPCSGDCILLSMYAGLEYGNGSQVPNTASGAVLHHSVVLNRGVQVWDPTCGKQSEHIFESGNERTVIPFYMPETGTKAGYHLRKSDKFAINTELMNMEDEEKWVWLTLSFDVVEGFSPEWKESKVVWVSVGPDRCTGSLDNPFGQTNLTVTQQPINDTFDEYSSPWVSPRDGMIIGSNSHLHNGGIDTQLYVGDKNICTSRAKYTKGAGGHSHGAPTLMPTLEDFPLARRQMPSNDAREGPDEQLSDQEQCAFLNPYSIAKGESMYLKTHYDFTKHAGMKNARGELDEVMAIAGVLMVFDYEEKNITLAASNSLSDGKGD